MPDDRAQFAESPAQTIDRVLDKYRVFRPADTRPGYAERLDDMLAGMAAHRDRIDAALQYTPGTHTHDDLVRMVLCGQLSLWDLGGSFMLTEIMRFPQCAHFHIFLAGGRMQALVEMHEDVLELARALQCEKLTLAGRPGWERALKGHGWVPHIVTLSKEV